MFHICVTYNFNFPDTIASRSMVISASPAPQSPAPSTPPPQKFVIVSQQKPPQASIKLLSHINNYNLL